MKIHSPFKFKQVVKHKLGDDEMFVDGIAVYSSGTTSYGCKTKDGHMKWYDDYEIESVNPSSKTGFDLEVNDKTNKKSTKKN